MDNGTGDVERKIISAAIECIEEYGVAGTTIRRIAQKAGVNSAAISYYFRGKDALIEKAMETGIGNAFDWGDFPDEPGMTPRERLSGILEILVAGALRYPGMARAEFHEIVTYGRYDTKAVKRLNEFVRQVEDDLRSKGLRGDGAEIRMALTQIFAASLLFSGVMPHALDGYSGFSLDDPGMRKRFVTKLVDGLLKDLDAV